MPSKLRILAGSLLFWPHKNLIFSVRRHFSWATVTASPPKFACLSEIPPHQRMVAGCPFRSATSRQSTLCTRWEHCSFGARSTFGTALVQKPCSPLRAIPPLGSAHEAQGRVCSPREIFSVNADRRRRQPVLSVATDCDVDLRVALPSIYPCRQGRAPPVLNLLAAGQKLTAARLSCTGKYTRCGQ